MELKSSINVKCVEIKRWNKFTLKLGRRRVKWSTKAHSQCNSTWVNKISTEHKYFWYLKQQNYFFLSPTCQCARQPCLLASSIRLPHCLSDLIYLVKDILLHLHHYFRTPSLSSPMATTSFSEISTVELPLVPPSPSIVRRHGSPRSNNLTLHCSSHPPGTVPSLPTKLLPRPQSWSLQKFSLLIAPRITAQATHLNHNFHNVIFVLRNHWGLPTGPTSFEALQAF